MIYMRAESLLHMSGAIYLAMTFIRFIIAIIRLINFFFSITVII